MIRVVVADDHPIVRRGLVQVLAEERDLQVAGEAADPEQLLALLERQEWDVVVLDLAMPGVRGLELVRTLAEKYPRPAIVVLSIHSAEHYALRVLKSGAAAYLNKGHRPRN